MPGMLWKRKEELGPEKTRGEVGDESKEIEGWVIQGL